MHDLQQFKDEPSQQSRFLHRPFFVLLTVTLRYLIPLLSSPGVLNLVQFPTRNGALIDLALVNFPNMFYVYKRVPIRMSSHCTLLFLSHGLLEK